MDSIEKYALFSGHSYDKNDQGAAHSANVTMITGTAMSDSADGVVSVDFGGNTISADDEQAVDVSTTCAVKEGDTVQVSVVGADGTAKSLLVTGVIAGGDRMQADIEGAKDTAASADAAATIAKENAAKANELANSAITNANAANEQAQAAMNSVNTANGKISALQKNVDTMNSDISTAQDAISKNASDITGINQKLSTDYATKGEVSDVKVAVESDIETKANALTASVAETYAAKSDVTKITDDLSNRISINEKGISSSSDEIKTLKSDTANISKDVTAAQDAASAAQKTADTAVSNANAAQTAASNAQSAVDNIQVGGRNLLLNSGQKIEKIQDGPGTSFCYKFSNALTTLKKGDYITISVRVDMENVVNFKRAGAEIGVKLSDGTFQYIGAWGLRENLDTKRGINLHPQNGVYKFHDRIQLPYKLGSDVTDLSQIVQNGAYIQEDGSLKFADGGYIRVSNPKLEIGNKATDWTPAPEDVQNDINTAQTAADNAKKAADTAQSTANGASTAAATAQSAADGAKTAASNAQTAANSAKTAADNAKSAADKANSDLAKLTDTVTTQGTKIDQNSNSITSVASRTTTVENKFTNYYTKTETNSQIKQTADGINSTVSKKVGKDEVISSINQSAEEVKINANRVAINGTLSVTDAINNAQTAADNAQTAVDNIQVGGRNLALNSAKLDIGSYSNNRYAASYQNGLPIVARENGMNEVRVTNRWAGIGVHVNAFNFNAGYEIVFSTNVYAYGADANIAFFAMCYNASGKRVFETLYIDNIPYLEDTEALGTIKAGGTKRLTVKIIWTDTAKSLIDNGGRIELTFQVENDVASGNYVSMYAPKLELGNKATDWTPAPEDVQNGIDAAQSTANTANSTANTTKTYFYNDSSGSHVISQNSTSAGTRSDVKADGMHIIDQDDGKELASFTSSGAAIGKDSEIHTKYSTDGINFYEKNKSYPFTRIYPVSIEKEKYSAASISSAPSDITNSSVMDDGLWHSTGAVSTSAVDGTSTDNNGWAQAVLGATTVQSGISKSASVEVFASNSNPNKGSGGVSGADNYINMTADEVYINNRAIPKIVSGTKVFHVVNINYADLFTYDEMKQILNINSIDATKICIFVQNGDADSSNIKLGNVEHRPSTNRWYVTFLESGDFYYRVNYVIVYNPEIREG